MLQVALVAASLTMVAHPAGGPGLLPSADAAAARDASGIADRLAVSPAEAALQLRVQQASVAATDDIAARYADRPARGNRESNTPPASASSCC